MLRIFAARILIEKNEFEAVVGLPLECPTNILLRRPCALAEQISQQTGSVKLASESLSRAYVLNQKKLHTKFKKLASHNLSRLTRFWAYLVLVLKLIFFSKSHVRVANAGGGNGRLELAELSILSLGSAQATHCYKVSGHIVHIL
eukprot:g24391.t1